MLIVRLLIGRDRHDLQTQFPPSGIELRNAPQFQLPSFHSASITAAAANPSATPINGLITANQKEMFQSEFSGVGFLFMPLFSSARRATFQRTFGIGWTADNADDTNGVRGNSDLTKSA